MLKYPNDRVNGFVLLSGANGNLYVPDFIKTYDRGSDEGNAMAYAGACLALARRNAQ